jgi:hypothetical protein
MVRELAVLSCPIPVRVIVTPDWADRVPDPLRYILFWKGREEESLNSSLPPESVMLLIATSSALLPKTVVLLPIVISKG